MVQPKGIAALAFGFAALPERRCFKRKKKKKILLALPSTEPFHLTQCPILALILKPRPFMS